jgi:hypothetical protein
MINFRFHLVSLIAVFLALATGIVIGSAVVQQAIVEGLRDQVNDVEARSEEIKRENDRLQSELGRRVDELDAMAPFAVDGRLTGVPVAVVAVRGADSDAVDEVTERLREARARAPVQIWLDDTWALEDRDDEARLQEILASPATGATLRLRALGALAARLATTALPAMPQPGEEPDAPPDLLRMLADAGFVTLDVGGGFDADDVTAWPGPGGRAVVVTGPDVSGLAEGFEAELARALESAGLGVVVAEAWREQDGGPARGERIGPVRDDDQLDRRVSTVDSLDLPSGSIAVVLALQDLGRGIVGHYGYGDGAARPVPAWSR